MANLTISLLGPPEIVLDGQLVTFESRKAIALLAYLAVTGAGHRRAEVAALLWPESDRQRGRGALRYTLSLLKKGLGDDWLRIDRQRLDLVRDPPLKLDVTEFYNLLAASQTHPHPQNEACPACIESLTQAVQLYRGDFLAGFSLRDSPDFDEWQFFQTESLRRDLALALERLTRYHAAQAETETAIAYARRWLNLDPLHEPIHYQLMALYAAAGQWAAAMRQYETCVQMLDETFGILPAAETRRLYERLRRDQAGAPSNNRPAGQVIAESPPPAPAASAYNLPRQLTTFIGREQELADLVQLIENDEVRLLNIVGPGGIGKTRLALEVATARRDSFAAGVHFVSLASLNAANTIIPAIAQAIGFSFSEGRESEAQLLAYLSARQMLLLLDNVEHLVSDAALGLLALLTAMLQTAPRLKILTTSRVWLNLQVEYVYPVQGLAHPLELMFEEATPGRENLLNIARYPALALFQQRAQQVWPGLAEAGLNDVARICRLTEGMPLAIELAAAMTGVLELPAIATEIERNLDVLSTDRPDVHARHRSMRAVFDSSWQTLTRAEQAVFARLTVFRGSFTREAATQVTQATLENLAGLVNKSLLRRQSSGRYEIHELMRQYATEKLAAKPAEKERAQQSHCDYYQRFLSRSMATWQADYRPEMMAGIALEIDNLRAGWQWALTRPDLAVALSYTENLWPFYKARGRFSEAVETLTQTLGLIRTHPDDVTQTQQAECERLLGEAYFGLGHLETSQEYLRHALRLVDRPIPSGKGRALLALCREILGHLRRHLLPKIAGHTHSNQEKQAILIAAKIYDRLSYTNYMASNSTRSSYTAVRGLNLAEIAAPSPILAIAYANMSSFYGITSRGRWAAYYAGLARKISVNFHDLPAQAAIAIRFTIYHGALGRWEQAVAEGQQALHWYQQLEDRRNWGDCLAILGIIALLRGHFQEGLTYCAALQTLSAGSYNVEHQSWAICGYALNFLYLGRTEEALAMVAELTPLLDQGDRITLHVKAAYYSIVAVARLREGKKELALQVADKAVALLRNKMAPNIAIILFYSHVAEVYLTLWEQAVSNVDILSQTARRHCQTQAQQICQNLYRFAWLFTTRRPFAYLYQGHYEWLAGRHRRARRLWHKSLVNAQQLALPYIEARAHYQLGRHLPPGEAQKEVHLRCAAEIFEKLEATYDLDQARAALAEIK